MFKLCIVLLFPVQSGCFFYTFPEHVLIPSCFNGNPDHTLPFHKEFSGIDLEYFFEVFYLFIRIFLMFYSVVYLVKFGCIFLYFDLVIPVDDTVSDLYIVYIRKSCFFQSLLCVVNDALKGMMYIFHFPFPEQLLFQTVPADTFFPFMYQHLHHGSELCLSYFSSEQGFSVIYHGKTAECLNL